MKRKNGTLIKTRILFALTALATLITMGISGLVRGGIVFYNGRVITMDQNNTVAQAAIVRNGKIEAVGGSEELLERKGALDKTVDLGGKTMIPGFVDAHSHFPGSGLKTFMADLNSPPIGKVHDMEELKAALRETAGKSHGKKWIVGFGYDDTLLAEKRHPTREDLDEVSSTRPILILHISGHLAVANSRMLDIVGIDENTPNPEGGVIQRYPGANRPNGVLEEKAVVMVQKKMPNPRIRDLISTIKYSIRDYASHGVTTAQNGDAEKLYITGLRSMSRGGFMPLRLVVWPSAGVGRKIVEGSYKTKKMNTSRFSVGAVKIIADGSIQGYTGYLSKPYYVPPSPDKPDYRGYPTIPREKLIEQVMYFHKAGMQIAIHGNGDAAIDDILDAFEQAQKVYPRKDCRHIIIHAQMAREDQLDRMKALGVIPSFFSLHTYYWGDRHMNIFMGPERAKMMSPARSAVDRNMRFTIHTDSPVVPMDPLMLMWSAVNRISSGGNAIGPEQRISPMQALRAVTIDAAWQSFLENDRGSIEKGKFADLVILSGNPLEDAENIRNIKVLETIVGGKTIYKAR